MKFTVNKDELLNALTPLSRVAPKVASMPILETLLIESKDGNLILSATDMEVMLRVKLRCSELEGDVKACIDLKLIQEFVKLSHKNDITAHFELNEGFIMQIAIGDSKCTISGLDGSDFPMMDVLQGNEEAVVSIPSHLLQQGLSSVMYACGNDDLRPALMGVNLLTNGGSGKLASTNGHILSSYEIECRGEKVDFTIPRKACGILSDDKLTRLDEIDFFQSGRNYCALLGDFMLYFRVVDAKYPNYDSVIPRDNPIELRVDKELLVGAIKRVGLFSNQTTRQLVLNFQNLPIGAVVQVKASDIDYGKSATEGVDVEFIEGDSIEIGFNSKFLVETLSSIEGDRIRFFLSAPNRAALIYGATDVHLCLVMPVMIS